jgi:diacylglycerol O-acyltransferase / wax synthase
VDQRPIPRRLSAADSLMWRIESDPVLRSPVLVVGLLDRSPTTEGLAEMIENAELLLPRLRQRITPPPLGPGRPRWSDVDYPSLAHHIRRVRAPGGDLDAALAVAEPDAAAAFDPARPPWTLTIVDGLDVGRSAVVLRFHHAVTDGVGGIALADRLFDHARRPDRAEAATPTPQTPPGAGTAPGWLDPRAAAGAAVAAVRAAGRGVAATIRPIPTLTAAVRLGRSAVRLLAPAPAGSPELVGRSLDRWLSVEERPLAAMRRAADAAGGTVNDVLLAAVAGALASYHRQQGRPVPAVRVTMPISIRRPSDAVGGNRFVPVRFTLPVDDLDPRARVRISGGIARGWRSEPAIGATDLLAAGLNLLPGPVVSRLFGSMLRSVDVNVANVPGLGRPAYVAGARIDRLWAFAPPAGAALSVTLVSHQGTCCIGLACDRRAVTDPELLHTCLDAALTEVVALGRARPARRPA